MKKAVIKFCRTAENGNIFDVLSRAVRELNRNGREAAAREMKLRVSQTESYDAALGVIKEYVNLKETKS